jgi:hypothetical protein
MKTGISPLIVKLSHPGHFQEITHGFRLSGRIANTEKPYKKSP